MAGLPTSDQCSSCRRIPDLIRSGAILTMADGYRVILADAGWGHGLLWWYEAFGREHLLECSIVQDDGTWLRFFRDGRLLATIGELEGVEDRAIFDAWQHAGKENTEAITQIKAGLGLCEHRGNRGDY